MKRLLIELERDHPGVRASVLKALGNVAPRHLLDRRLNPIAEAAQDVSDAKGGSGGLLQIVTPMAR
jgi:hypothetical protein